MFLLARLKLASVLNLAPALQLLFVGCPQPGDGRGPISIPHLVFLFARLGLSWLLNLAAAMQLVFGGCEPGCPQPGDGCGYIYPGRFICLVSVSGAGTLGRARVPLQGLTPGPLARTAESWHCGVAGPRHPGPPPVGVGGNGCPCPKGTTPGWYKYNVTYSTSILPH